MGLLDDLSNLFGSGSMSTSAPQPASTGMTNYGATPPAQGIAQTTPVGQVLARLRSPSSPANGNPLGLSTPIGGNDLATAMSGLSAVRPGAGKFSAFAQGLAGAMGARSNANIENAKLAQQGLLTNIEALKYAQAAQIQQQQMQARVAGANALSGGAPQPQQAPAAPPTSGGPMQLSPATAPVNLPGETAAPPAAASPAPAADPSAQPAPTPKMIPHVVAQQPDFWSTVAPDSNPAYIDQQAGQYETAAKASALDPETSKRYGDTANQYRQRAQQIRTNGMVTLNDGSQALIPGFAASKATAAAITKAAEQNVIDQHELVQTQPVPGGPTINVPKSQVLAAAGSPQAPGVPQPQGGAPAGAQQPGQQPQSGPSPGPGLGSPPGGALPTGINVAKQPDFVNQRIDQMWKDQSTMTDQYHARQDAIGRLQQMQGILSKYQTGAFSDTKANALADLKAVTGIDLDPDTVNNYQEFQKLATKQVFNDVKSMGGRVLVSEIEGLTRANANPNLQPGANQAILGSAIGALQRENKYYEDFTKWHGANPTAYDSSGFEQDWNKANPAIAYSEQGIKDTAAKGITIPPVEQRQDGQMYVTPKGPARWVAGKGWQLQGGQ